MRDLTKSLLNIGVLIVFALTIGLLTKTMNYKVPVLDTFIDMGISGAGKIPSLGDGAEPAELEDEESQPADPTQPSNPLMPPAVAQESPAALSNPDLQIISPTGHTYTVPRAAEPPNSTAGKVDYLLN
jgi:hypothetical protein